MKILILKELSIVKEFFRNKKYLILLAFLLYIINSAVTVIMPIYLGKLIDIFRDEEIKISSVFRNGREFLTLFCILTATQIASGILIAILNKEARIHYQNLILYKILKLPYLQQIKFRTAYLQSRWVEDSLNISSLFGENLFGIIKNILIILLGIGIALWLSVKFSLLLLGFLFLITLGMFSVSKYLIKQLKKYMEDFSNLSGKVNETLAGILEIKIMGFLNFFQKIIRTEIKRIAEKFLSIQLKGLLFLSLLTLVIFGGFLAILLYFGLLLAHGEMSLGTAIGYIAIVFIVIKSLTGLLSQINGLNRVFASLKRTTELMELPEEAMPQEGKKEIERIESIELKNIWFKYDGNNDYLLKDFSYRFEKGKIYAITGKSGIGKTTLVKILLGIIPAEKGEIILNGNLLRRGEIFLFWERIGYLSQEPFLFKGKIIENLCPEIKKLNEESIKKALLKAGLKFDEFSTKEIEEGGRNLSGGEKSRLSLARAFLKEPDVLILDEPTSQIDPKTEEFVMNSITHFVKEGKIAIIIAHRTSTLEWVDEIINMESQN